LENIISNISLAIFEVNQNEELNSLNEDLELECYEDLDPL